MEKTLITITSTYEIKNNTQLEETSRLLYTFKKNILGNNKIRRS